MQHSLWKRLMWLVILWGGSVLALAAVGMFFRLLMTAAGFKAHKYQHKGPVNATGLMSQRIKVYASAAFSSDLPD